MRAHHETLCPTASRALSRSAMNAAPFSLSATSDRMADSARDSSAGCGGIGRVSVDSRGKERGTVGFVADLGEGPGRVLCETAAVSHAPHGTS